jgi:hypothetical protein
LSHYSEAAVYYSDYAKLPPLQRPKHTWVFTLVDDGKLCESCDEFRGEEATVEDPTELQEAFPYGEQVDAVTFACNIHPNCRCIMERIT